MTSKKLITTIIILTAAFVFLGLGCKDTGSDQTQTATPELLSQDPASFDEQFNAIKNHANELAIAYRQNAKLVYVRVKIPAGLNLDLTQYTFVYDSVSDQQNHWVVTFEKDANTFIRALIPKSDFLGSDLKQILPLYWKTNFVSVLQKAEPEIGEKFRAEHINDYKIELNLSRKSDEPLTWTCEYSTLDGSVIQSIKISAESGEIIK